MSLYLGFLYGIETWIRKMFQNYSRIQNTLDVTYFSFKGRVHCFSIQVVMNRNVFS